MSSSWASLGRRLRVRRLGDYLPILACEDGLEIAIEHFATGRRGFQAERVVAAPHACARDFALRARKKAGQQLTFLIFDSRRNRHGTRSTFERRSLLALI